MAKIEVEINDGVLAELDHLVAGLKQADTSLPVCEDRQQLIEYVMCAIADGSRRPGAWERTLLDMLGLVPQDMATGAPLPGFDTYRSDYGGAD